MHSDYYFNGFPRLAFGLDNPNAAAAIIVALMPMIWAIRWLGRTGDNAYIIGVAATTAEVLMGLALVLTFSRAAVVAWVLGLGLFAWYLHDTLSMRVKFIPFRLAVAAIFVAITGLGSRFHSAVAGDASVANRISLWTAGVQMLSIKPLAGWGKGLSGLEYMNWFQDPGSTAEVGGMVNSLLHIGVEFGIVAFVLVFGVQALAVVSALAVRKKLGGPVRCIVAAIFSSSCALFVCNIFSTLWTQPIVSILWMVVIVGTLFAAYRAGISGLRVAAMATIATFAVSATLLIVGRRLQESRPIRVSVGADGGVILEASTGRHPDREVMVKPDALCLGRYYGHPIRIFLAANDSINRLVVCPLNSKTTAWSDTPTIFFGAAVKNWNPVCDRGKIAIVCPAFAPPATSATGIPSVIILPEFDELGYASQWRQYARTNHIPTVVLDGDGQDIVESANTAFEKCLQYIL